MNKAQYLAVLSAAALFFVLYFGFDTKTDKQKTAERSRAIQAEVTDFETLLANAKASLTASQAVQMAEQEQMLHNAGNDAERATSLKRLSGLWHEMGQFAVAGGFAEQVAEIENADSSWSVAGATFYNGLVSTQDPIVRDYCAAHAVKAFESAASLNPSKAEHRVNLALVYAENPPPNNPMQAVMMLRELEEKHPDDPTVFNALGRLAIKTGQWDRAIQRLEKAWSLDKNNPNTPCLLAKAYQGAGNTTKANEFASICNAR
ncbi:MAG: tetratricopeptide repeat protein [Saprospiraceae bacterium]|nr:tetratricopeptide repeat protein [Saprospiraceae bacterium]